MVIYNGIDVQKFRKLMHDDVDMNGILPHKQPGEIWAVFAGSLGPSYDIPTLLDMAKRLDNSPLNLRIIIAGDGPSKVEVENYIADKRHSSLHYVGKLAPEKLASLYRLCDIGLCAYSQRSNVEMPDKIYDYTAAGLPVINSLRGEVSEMIKERRIGLQYRAGDAEDLLTALKLLTSNRSLREEMAKNSITTGMVYDRHVQYAKLVELIKKLCS
jgi:glycosyltransferase involved in cell wall biosynthesis